jgi:DDE superfamily endonuclease
MRSLIQLHGAGPSADKHGSLGYNRGSYGPRSYSQRSMKTIVRRSTTIATFVGLLALSLTAAQQAHLQRFADLLVVAPRRKTLAELAAQECDGVDPSNLADFFRISPWDADDVRVPLAIALLRYLRTRGIDPNQPIYLTLDDSLALKDKDTRCLEPVDWHFDHNRKRMVQASNHVVLGIHWGGFHFPLSWRLYLRQSTVRKRNRRRRGPHKLRYHSKLELARQLLEQVVSLLPPGPRVYVLFDSWYTSAKLVRFIRQQGWHVIAGIKSNRKLSGRKLTDWHTELQGRRYEKTRTRLANGYERTYWVRSVQGRLRGVPGDVRVVLSQKGPGQRTPKYFLCTDPTLSAQAILQHYQVRWSQEVDFWHVKLQLGLGDFRLQRYEAVEKWYTVVYFVFAYLYWCQYETPAKEGRATTLSEVLEQIRADHQRAMLTAACTEVAQGTPLSVVLARYLDAEPLQAA